MGRVTRISGELTPTPSVLLMTATFGLPSFDVTVNGRTVVLTPCSGIEVDGHEARDRAEHEIDALLAVLGSEGSEPLHFKVMEMAEEDSTGTVHVADFSFGVDSNTVTITPGPESLARLGQQVTQASEDLVYRELLVLLLLARRAKNPRPTVYNMVERLETKYGGRREACLALGLTQATVTPVVRDQGDYDGDRHADHPVGASRPEIPHALRNEVLDVATRLVRAYEAATWPSAAG